MADLGRRQLLGKAGLVAAGVVAGAGAAGGTDLWRAQRAAGRFNASVGCPAQRGSARVHWSGPAAGGRRVALTFDDGPTTQFTERVLELLDEHEARATFFMIGECVQRHPDLARRVRDAGHEIASHGHDHVRAPGADPHQVEDAVRRGAQVLRDVLGTTPRFFRPPRGEMTTVQTHAAGALGQDVVLWSLDRGPAADDDAKGVAAHLLAQAHPGAVVCLHDGIGRSSFDGKPDGKLMRRRTAEVDALPEVLTGLRRAGYAFVTVAELLGVDDERS